MTRGTQTGALRQTEGWDGGRWEGGREEGETGVPMADFC